MILGQTESGEQWIVSLFWRVTVLACVYTAQNIFFSSHAISLFCRIYLTKLEYSAPVCDQSSARQWEYCNEQDGSPSFGASSVLGLNRSWQ